MGSNGRAVFLRQFLDRFETTGAIAPSSAALAREITAPFRARDRSRPVRVLEVGPGTGAFTLPLLRELGPDDRLDLVEANAEFVRYLAELFATHPTHQRVAGQVRLIHGCVPEAMPAGPYDFVVSGLPLNNFQPGLVQRILEGLLAGLAAGGVLSYFEYLAVRDLKRLFVSEAERRRLDGVEAVLGSFIRRYQFRARRVYANLPPACARHLRRGILGRKSGARIGEAAAP